ncbi:hypothetical protein B0H14DRAFT_3480202 [Mycena olivaceomarginata]|nr:hypothetical protein B0H14DRAFT_3480202 [Mycena olivaceomarginata]
MRYMNALAPPFPPPVPNSITRRSKRLVLATLHVVLGVSASRPLALTLLDASTPMSRQQRIHRAKRELSGLGAYALGSHVSRSRANGSVANGLVFWKPELRPTPSSCAGLLRFNHFCDAHGIPED